MYILNPAVFYRKYENDVVCYQTREHKIYKFNDIVFDVLEGVKARGTADGVIDYLRARYSAETIPENIAEIVENFLKQLVDLKIIRDTKLKQKWVTLESEIINGAKAGELREALIELTYRCSEKCRHCYVVQSAEGEMTIEEVFSLLDQLKELGAFEVTFTGGELFLRKDVMQILRHAYSIGLVMNIFTNGISITDEQLIELVRLCPRSVHFSLYSSKPEKHDAITRVKGSFERTLETAKKLIAMGVSVNIKSLGLKQTYEDIPELIELVESIGATIQIGFSISPKNDNDLTPTTMRIGDYDNLKKAIRYAKENIEIENGVYGGRDIHGPICGAGINGITINPRGEVFPCNALAIPLGNIRESSLREIWESEKLKNWRANTFDKLKDCNGCDKADFCGFCPGVALSEKGSPFAKYEEACAVAQARKELKI